MNKNQKRIQVRDGIFHQLACCGLDVEGVEVTGVKAGESQQESGRQKVTELWV